MTKESLETVINSLETVVNTTDTTPSPTVKDNQSDNRGNDQTMTNRIMTVLRPNMSKSYRAMGCSPHRGGRGDRCSLCGRRAWRKHPTASVCVIEQDGVRYRMCRRCYSELVERSRSVNGRSSSGTETNTVEPSPIRLKNEKTNPAIPNPAIPNPISHIQMLACPTCGMLNPISRANVYIRCDGCGRRLMSVKVHRNNHGSRVRR